ncbi:general substrate transporter [Trichoderma velutinum]
MAPPGEDGYRRSNLKVIGFALIVSLAAILYGLDLGETSGFLAMPVYNRDFGKYNAEAETYVLTAQQQTVIYGTTLAGALVAAAFSGYVGTHLGRRFGLFLCAIMSIIGPAVQTGATSFGVMVTGRVIGGIGYGFAANFVIPYWAEITPASLRGLTIVMYQGVINVFQFVGQCINQGTHEIPSRWSYRAPLLTQLLPPILLIAFLPFIPDTPRFYISRGKIDKALKSMRRLRGPTWPDSEVQDEIKEITAFVELEEHFEGSSSWKECFQGTDLRRTALSIMTPVFQNFSGISFISGYGTFFFTISGVQNPFLITIISGLCGIAGSATSFLLIKYIGRRPILIGGSIVCGISMATFAIVGTAAPTSVAAAKCLSTFVCLFIFAYGATWGPVSQVMLGELSSNKLRSKTLSLSLTLGWFVDLFILCGMPYLLSADYVNLGAKVGFIFGGSQIVICICTFFFMPETKDRTLEEIDEMFMNNIPAREFKDYVCTGTVQGIPVEARSINEEKGITTTMEERV